jgi:hypothetical protein
VPELFIEMKMDELYSKSGSWKALEFGWNMIVTGIFHWQPLFLAKPQLLHSSERLSLQN